VLALWRDARYLGTGSLASVSESLRDYRTKRDFRATPEPAPKAPRGKARAGASRSGADAVPDGPRFVVQEHSARRLHWDLRLEHDGALASWALPRGVPDDPKRNHKAVRTEDHPLEYLDFHGDIPAGNYGAGSMRIWDRGSYEVEKWRDGEVIAVFYGERMRGRYALFRAGEDRDWLIHRMDPAADPGREPMPQGIVPMLARPGKLPVDERRWAYEIKWDGVRAIAYCEPGEIRVESRNLRDITRTYPELRPLARALGSRTAVLDGEIVAFDENGRPSFSRLQERMHVDSDSAARRRAQRTPVTLMIFDVLYLDGHSLMALAYDERRTRLEELGLAGAAWQTPARHIGDGKALLAATAEQGLEGLVAKRRDCLYEPGRRGSAWIKVKNTRRQELVVGGWVPGEGKRAERIGALLMGHYDPDGCLRYAGRVGTGFTEKVLDDLAGRLASLRRPESPFSSARMPRGALFVDPELVAEVEFTEWTPDGQLRHPTYRGLREDRPAGEVVREDPLALEGAPAGGGALDDSASEAGSTPRARARRPAKRSRSPAAPPRPAAPDSAPEPARAPGGAARGPEPIFEDVRPMRGGYQVRIEGRELRLSNYDKVLFPATGFTKGDMIEYYARVAPVILPHLRDRPLTLKRYPNGVSGDFFYEKNCPGHRPEWVQTAPVGGRRRGATIHYCLIQDAPTLVWAANLASIELHTSLARFPDVDVPTMMVFDLDPGPPAALLQCCEVALVLRGLFAGLGLSSLVKTSGSKGLQVYVPLNVDVDFRQIKAFARQVAELLAGQAPDLVVSRMTKSARAGRVLVDWSQNDEHKTTVNVYSVRAQEQPTVSAPVSWDQVQAAHDSKDADGLGQTTAQVLERIAREGDLLAPLLSLVQELPSL
jgi:bifunctional non-homologous end joining protein LigD